MSVLVKFNIFVETSKSVSLGSKNGFPFGILTGSCIRKILKVRRADNTIRIQKLCLTSEDDT